MDELLLWLFLTGLIALGYVAGCLYPLDQLRAALTGGLDPRDEFRRAIRQAVGCPARVSDLEVVTVVAAIMAERRRPDGGGAP